MIKYFILVFFGGAFGASFRYITNLSTQYFFNSSFPYGTLIVNILGSFFIGILASILKESYFSDDAIIKYFLMIGFLGSFTTFSAFSLETIEMLSSGENFQAYLYIILSLILNIIAVYLGINILNFIFG